MRKICLFLLLLPAFLQAQKPFFSSKEIRRWENQARQVTIIRDHYGVPHIYGHTDADAVFGLLYAQCEDDFPRVEMNYVEKLGRLSEVKGISELYNDLLNRIVIDSAGARRDFERAPGWLKKLCQAFADGVNYYLFTHPSQPVALLHRFEPWFPLLWTDGSIGAISTADITGTEFRQFFSGGSAPDQAAADPRPEEILTGSNGFAFSPSITAHGHAILYINPHVTFYFRPEVHMVSDEGLNAYGAVTWGQFFIYQGFNERCGWMHTSSYADAADSYIEKLSRQNGQWSYRYDGAEKPVTVKTFYVKYKAGGAAGLRSFQVLFTGHGPVIARRNGEYLSLRADNRLMNGLIQCWERTKARNLADFKKTLELDGNISNNTVYADADGNIAYWHGNRMPVRDPSLDWSKPVDGTTSATEWKGLLPLDQGIHVYNPPNGWLQNCNSTPFSAAGPNSPRAADYPAYMAPDGENFRGLNAVRVLSEGNQYTLDKVIAAGYDTRLTAFEILIPALLKAYDSNSGSDDSLRAELSKPMEMLRNWDERCGTQSVATSLAVTWGERIWPAIMRSAVATGQRADQLNRTRAFVANASPADLLRPLQEAIRYLNQTYGSWEVPWGEINRFQRISGDIENHFDDRQASIPVGYVSSLWGMLPSYTSRTYPGTRKRYGVNGNSFICAVEFGDTVKAKSLLAGGESGHPESPHFKDQAVMYSRGIFKPVWFYRKEVEQHAESTYHPGQPQNN